MSKKKIICLVIPSLQAGGMERVMTELANHFSLKEDLEVHLILYGISREIFFNLPGKIKIHTPYFEFNNDIRTISSFKTLRYLRNTIKSLKPDSILSFGEYWNTFVLLALWGLPFPVYVSDRSQPDKSLGKLHDCLRKFFYRSAKGVIIQTIKAREVYMKKKLHRNIIVIGNPIRFVRKDNYIKKENIILMVGRLIESKHQDILIEIFSRTRNESWKLMIVGYDHLKQRHMERLKKLANELGIGDKVIFTGKSENVDELYLKSSIFAFTSSSEGFPNVIGEAMTAGLPVVAFDCVAGPSDLIEHGKDGFLVPLFDNDRFVAHLNELMDNEKLRIEMGKEAYESIKRFANSKICEDFYKALIES